METTSTRGSTGQLSTSGSTGISGGMHHSMSTPAGVDGGTRTPPATPKKGGKILAMRVQMLDDTVTIFQVQAKADGSVLFEQVCKQLHLLEADYFGLEYLDAAGTRYWLDLQKPLSRQLGLSLVDPLLFFCVKFYTPDPGQLEEEFTRYLFCLQVKRDLSQGYMQCNENTAALMASYIVQAECGDFVPEDYPDHKYLSSYKFVPHQDNELERKIMENHKKHAGQSPAEADLNLLETARRCELYGVKIHPAKDHENVALNLAVAHMGILVFQNYTKINTFSWAKIRKISFKRKRFLIKLHPEGYGYYKDTVEFFFEGRNECKNFWKKCVENHGFFRCSFVKHIPRHKTRVLSRGSSFRYSGKTQKQIIEYVRDNYVKRQAFQRSASFRHSSAHSSASNMNSGGATVGNSISAHPLLPLGDSTLSVEAAKLSASLGSMGRMRSGSPTTRSAYRPPGTATCWTSEPDTRPVPLAEPSPTTNSHSPPLTTQSVTTSPQQRRVYLPPRAPLPYIASGQPPRTDNLNGYTGISTTCTKMPSSPLAKSEGSLDQANPPAFIIHCPSQTQSQYNLGFPPSVHTQTSPDYFYATICNKPKRQVWHRSASCKDLYDFSFEETGQGKRGKRRISPPTDLGERNLESPITRYDDHHSIYSTHSRNNSLEIDQDIIISDHKVYSSSYPGTQSYSQESVEDPGNYDLRDSQEELSHDSYELIEKSDDDSGEIKYRKKPKFNTRSCSLDSGNYIPSDSDSDDIDKHHKCKSSSDVAGDIFAMEDPRDLPREIIPRKSDGSFYKTFKQLSRTSSTESKSDYYEPKAHKSSKESLKKHSSFGSRTSSQESKSDYENKRSGRYDSSQESRSEYYDPPSKTAEVPEFHDHHHEYDRQLYFERNYGTNISKTDNYVDEINRNQYQFVQSPTSHVHSMTVQNVEMPREQNTVPRACKPRPNLKSQASIEREKVTHIWPESIAGLQTEIREWPTTKQSTGEKSTDSESNVFSFDEDRIQSLQNEFDSFGVVPNIDVPVKIKRDFRDDFRDVFGEIEPRMGREPISMHQPIERTKSDPNSLSRQRLSSRRLLLMHQKSIDLTPCESSDDDYLYKQIPSAPPIMKYRDTHFEMPTAEFGHFDIIKREMEGAKTKFEVPKRQFEELGVKAQSDFVNLPPKQDDIPYVLHKRHIMNGTAPSAEIKSPEPVKPKIKSPTVAKESDSQFLFTQNIDLSKVDPVTLEIDKSEKPLQHLTSPKRDITHIDPVMLETLSSKLSQIESDSPTSSRTDSLKPHQKMMLLQKEMQTKIEAKRIDENFATKNEREPEPPKIIAPKVKTTGKPKRIIKPRMQPGKKGGKSSKTKVRITSFSSDDESLDSDDVFGSAEATPTRMEFSPPQMRKEMESILKFESERKYLQYTMSSTEIEGSPPTTRKKVDKKENGLDAIQTELRRISERSISIPSSEDDFNIQTADLQPVFMDVDGLTTVQELDKEDNEKSCDETLREHTLSEDILKNDETIRREEERLREKLMLQAEIENDIKNLRVPSRTKITEITPSSARRRGQSPLLFAHARLNLSEGSAFSLLQKQQASESPISGRRAISLDAPIIPVSRLPALNAFSSKDDTVEEDDQIDIPTATESEPELPKTPDFIPSKEESDQIVPDVVGKGKKSSLKTTRSRSKEVKSPKPTLPIRGAKALPKGSTKTSPSQRSLPTSLDIPTEIKRTKSQELGEATKTIPKEKSRSLDKEPKRVYSRERSASQEDSDTDIAKRKEKQQMLYEIAIKQTKTIKSPVKDSLPVFPQVEEMVRERHGKLEISINTIENTSVSLEDAIIITKSPKKLDKKIDKLTKSLEINLTDSEIDNWKMQRLGQSLDLDTRSESEPKTEFDFEPDVVAQNKLDDDQHDEVVLEGTSLDVYLSVDEKKYHDRTHLNGIKIIKESKDFCEASTGKPPDIRKLEAKSSSDSQSIEKVSLGNSLDIKYIDDSGDSSYKSENDAALELQKASNTMSKFLKKKLESRKKQIIEHKPSDESLTEVSEIRETPVIDRNFLSVDDATLRLSIERSRSEDTGSWMTVECDEFIGTEESFEYDNTPIASPKEEKPATTPTRTDTTKLQVKPSKLEILQRSSDQSRSSESWTSGEKELSPSGNVKEEESSASVSMGRIIGFSQPVEMFSKDIPHSPSDHEPPRSPRSPRMSIIGRTFTIDEGSLKEDKGETSSDEAYEIPRDLPPITEDVAEEPTSKKPYPFDEKWSSDSELSQRVHQKIIRKLSSNDKSNVSLEDYKDLKRVNGKTPLHSLDKMSTDSKNSVDTESSSGSFGVAARLQKSGDIPKELSSTWKPFPLDSSGSESFDDGFLPADQEINAAAEREYFMCRDTSGDFAQLSDISYKLDDTTPTRDDTDIPDDLAQFSGNFNYPSLTTALGDGISINLQTGFLSRTLSRISERSTNSEKSSVDEESTKASSQSDSLQDETSSNPHASFSSDPPSLPRPNESIKKLEAKKEPSRNEKIPNINNLLQRQISDDRRTSAEMAELSMDDIEIITSERGLKLKRQNSDDTIIDEECLDEDKSNSQESDEWPLPEIPKSHTQKNLLAMHDIPSSDTSQQTTQVYQFPRGSIPKTFGLKGSLKSQDSEQWPSPPSSVVEPPVVDNVTTYYMSPPEEACKVMVDSKSTTYEDDSNSDNEGNRTLDLDTEKTHTYENVATEPKSGSISESLSIEVSGVKIVLPEGEENDSDEPMSNDDVFVDTIESRNELRPPTVMRRSSGGSDDSSHSNRKKSSHSSYSEEDATSTSMTNVENDTVRIAVRPTKCTHSSHSEDTSIALSLSEWSNSTNTVKFQNLSSNSTNKSSSGIKSEENSLTDIAHSVSEWSNSSTMKAQQQSASSMQFQKLSSTSTGDSTLTDLIPTISDWTSSDSTLVPEQFFNPITDRKSISRLGSSIDDTDIGLSFDPKSIQSPRNIPSEDMALFSKSLPSTTYSKSTERPMIIPTLSDTEKSSSSVEQRTVHTQRYDKDKQRYFQKHQTRSTDRPVKAPMKLSKCSPYYSSSLSSESTPLAGSSPIPINKTATVPLMRTHRKPLSKTLFQAKSPPSENDSTSSVESPKSKSERDRRGYRRKRQTQLQRKREKEQFPVDEYFYVEHDNTFTEYNEYLRNKSMEEMAASFQYEAALAHDCTPRTPYVETLEEGYYPDGDSQSGSDIYRREDDDRFEAAEGFDISLIPPPLLEDDFESDNNKTHI